MWPERSTRVPGYKEKLEQFGMSPETVRRARRDLGNYECYLEYHIEQGGRLDASGNGISESSTGSSALSGMM